MSSVLRRTLTTICVIAAIGLSACTTASIDDVAPVAADFPPAPAAPASDTREEAVEPVLRANALAPLGEPANTGTYPNLNIQPDAAATQIDAVEKASGISKLKATQSQTTARTAGLRATSDEARLRKLGQTHADDALKAIESTE
ncbi:MAG: hypothetical protein AB7I79_10620 [Rhizobiaceae bacterium]